ncbi:unnamed protein product [Chilo suppressalis]|uniref:EIF-4F 25 kDa subunit n=1 Tax=Chilo suppressalis TaxID=168631 RepID=A0ABN8L8S4_CHISP|nr:unnamed protein product [Chilo suppressalis]
MGGKTSETAALPSPVKSVVVELIPPSLVDEKASETNSIEQIKHPLENTWTVWFYTNTSQKWNENLVNITSFDTVEDFWCLFHHMKLPSELQHGQEYSIFKGGVRPMWEDAANKKGGRLLIPVDRKNYEEVNKIWLDTILLMIGENFNDLNRIIRGVVVNIRPKTDRTKVARADYLPVSMAVWSEPADTCRMGGDSSSCTHAGTSWCSISPVPSWPSSLHPTVYISFVSVDHKWMNY